MHRRGACGGELGLNSRDWYVKNEDENASMDDEKKFIKILVPI